MVRIIEFSGPQRGHLFNAPHATRLIMPGKDKRFDIRAYRECDEQVWPLANECVCRAYFSFPTLLLLTAVAAGHRFGVPGDISHSLRGCYEQVWPLATNVLAESMQTAHPAS